MDKALPGCSEEYRQRKRALRRVLLLFLASYISILLISSISSIIYYKRVETHMLDSAKRTSMAMLEQLKIDMDNKIEYVNKLSNSMIFNDKINMLLRDNQTVYSYNDLMKDMMGFTKSDFIYDYYIYFANSDDIATSTIKMSPKYFYDNVYGYEGINYDEWYSELHEYHFRHYMPMTELNAYGSQNLKVITFMQTIPLNRSNVLGQIVILINESKINAIIDKMNWASGAHIYVLNKNNDVIIASKDAPSISDEIKLSLNTTEGLNDRGKDPDGFMVTYDTSEDTGWKYIMVTPNSKFFTEINRIKTNGYLLLSAFFFIGIILAYFYAYRNYRPIKEISDIIGNEAIGNIKSNNEFENIKTSIIQTLEKKKELKETISEQAPIMRSGYFTKLLKGYPGITDIEKDSLSFLQIDLLSDRFMVMIAEISDDCEFFQVKNDGEWILARFALMNVGEELFNNSFRCYLVEIDQSRVAFILNFPHYEDAINDINEFKKIFVDFYELISEKCKLSITCGASSEHIGTIQLRECYDEAMKALEYSIVKGKGNIIYFEELSWVDNYYYYPIDTEIQIINLLRSGDYDNTTKIIDMVFDVNFKSRRISYGTGRCLIVEMISTLMKVMNVILAKSGETMVSMDDMVNSVFECKTINDMCIKIKDIANNICQLVKLNQEAPGEKLVNDIIGYIRKNYSENSLSLITIAEAFNITPQYVSTIFKKHTSENIKDFIAKIKLEKAKELLSDSRLTTSDIAYKLGYADEKGIIRLFKKYEGITPGSFRKSIGIEE